MCFYGIENACISIAQRLRNQAQSVRMTCDRLPTENDGTTNTAAGDLLRQVPQAVVAAVNPRSRRDVPQRSHERVFATRARRAGAYAESPVASNSACVTS